MFESTQSARMSSRRRAAQAFVVPVLAAGLLGAATPAIAATATAGGICNGVTNQQAHRGMVQPNLLKAAADGLQVGPILLGMKKPLHVLVPSVTARGIVNLTAVAVQQANALKAG